MSNRENKASSPEQWFNWVITLSHRVILVGLLLIILALIAEIFGFKTRYISVNKETGLYLAGMWWLIRGGRLNA